MKIFRFGHGLGRCTVDFSFFEGRVKDMLNVHLCFTLSAVEGYVPVSSVTLSTDEGWHDSKSWFVRARHDTFLDN